MYFSCARHCLSSLYILSNSRNSPSQLVLLSCPSCTRVNFAFERGWIIHWQSWNLNSVLQFHSPHSDSCVLLPLRGHTFFLQSTQRQPVPWLGLPAASMGKLRHIVTNYDHQPLLCLNFSGPWEDPACGRAKLIPFLISRNLWEVGLSTLQPLPCPPAHLCLQFVVRHWFPTNSAL